MNIEHIVCPTSIEEKLATKHHIVVREVREVLLNQAKRVRFAEKGHTLGQDVYAAFSQTFAGRYVAVFFIYKPDTRTAIIISARDMSMKERKTYGRK